jgi:hypothetical protein
VVFANILRAAPGYELSGAFKKIVKKCCFRNIWIRPCYKKPSFRNHDKGGPIDVDIIYEDFSKLPRKKEIFLLKPDTEATGKTGKKAIDRMIEKCEEVESTIKEIVLYGFISIPGLKLISDTAKKHGIKLSVFSIGNITELAYNGYDMPLYGLDESLWREKRSLRKIGSIVDIASLKRFLPEFIPGSDQPGDWSNRQSFVYSTKIKKEPGKIKDHYESSIRMINSLRDFSEFESWQNKIAQKELNILKSNMWKYI